MLGAHAAPPPILLGQTREEFASRRSALRQAAGGAVVVVVPTVAESDRARFRADNTFVYLTGLETGRGALALLPDGDPLGEECVLFVGRSRSEGDAVESARVRTGIAEVRDQRDLWQALKPSLERADVVLIAGPVGQRAMHQASGAVEQRIREINPNITVKDVSRLVADLRLRKSPGEIANLRSAVASSVQGFRRAATTIRPGVTELAVEGAVLAGFREAGAAREGFPCVIGAGPNSTALHNDPTDRAMLKGETVVVDIGAEVNYYTADLTRTFPVGGRFTPRAREIYDLVRDVQLACEKRLEPGKTTWQGLNAFAREQFKQSRLRAADATGDMRTMDRFFTHGLGHWLGMDVHDVGSMSGPIPIGSVITIEPGLYIPSESIGIRIEDDYLVTAAGLERLSAALPNDAASIERMMRGR